MRNIRYKYLFVILSVVFISTLENLYSQVAVNTYSLEINTNDIEIVKFINGYQLYLKKKPNVYGYRIRLKRQDGFNSYLYIDNSGSTNSIIRIRESDYHYKLGEVFKVFIPQNVYLDRRNNNSSFTLRDNITLILEAYNINNDTLINNEIILKANDAEISTPTITLRNVEKEGDLYAFYLYYSGGDNGEYAFYVREGKTNTSYKLIDTSYGNTGNYDSSGIILEDTFNRDLGKEYDSLFANLQSILFNDDVTTKLKKCENILQQINKVYKLMEEEDNKVSPEERQKAIGYTKEDIEKKLYIDEYQGKDENGRDFYRAVNFDESDDEDYILNEEELPEEVREPDYLVELKKEINGKKYQFYVSEKGNDKLQKRKEALERVIAKYRGAKHD